MTAPLTDRELDRVLDAWFGEGPATVSDAAVAGALERIPTTRRRPSAGGFLGAFTLLLQAERLRPAMRTAGIVVVLSALLGVVALTALIGAPPTPDPSPTPAATASPTGRPDGSQAPSSATGVARAVVNGATDLDVTYAFCEWDQFVPPPPIPEALYSGLNEYGFYEEGFGTCPEAYGYGLFVYVRPDDSLRSGEQLPTGDRVVLRFTFPEHFAQSRPYTNSHVSDQGECVVTFARFTQTEVEGSFDCVDVPSLVNAALISVTGDFSFDPRFPVAPAPQESPIETPGLARVDLELTGSPLPPDQWRFFGCPPVTITEPDGDRVCRFSDLWHRLEMLGLFEPELDTASIATTGDGISVRIWWYRGEIGDSLHNGDFRSIQGECQLAFTVMTEIWAEGTIDCSAVPGAFSTTVGGTEQEATVDLRGSFAFNPSIGAVEGY